MTKYQVESARWNSIILTISTSGPLTSEGSLVSLIRSLEGSGIRTLHVYVEEQLLPDILPLLISIDYQFRRYHQGIYCYYRWLLLDVEDKVHPYATATAGASALILSPDEQEVLMIYEAGMWKFVTGAIDYNESALTTVIRETREEVGLYPDPLFAPVFVGMWNIAGRTDQRMNDFMFCFAIRATSTAVVPDPFEINVYRWIRLDDHELVNAIQYATQTVQDPHPTPKSIEHGGKPYCYPHLLWLANWLDGRGMTSHTYGNWTITH